MTLPIWEPIADIEDLSRGKTATLNMPENLPVEDGLGGGLARDWPQRMVIAGSQFKRIVSAVTDELLQWTIKLEKRGIKGDNMNFDEKEKQSAGNMVFNIGTVQGNVGNVSHSQANFQNYSAVHQLLIDQNVPMRERHELEGIMEELKTAPPEKKPSLIQRGKDWITKNKEFLGASAEIVSKAIGATTQ
jgi:large-conductance mechanosensitive channel